MNILQLLNKGTVDETYIASGWVRTCRTSSINLGFCNINDGSNVDGMQIVLSIEHLSNEILTTFLKMLKPVRL